MIHAKKLNYHLKRKAGQTEEFEHPIVRRAAKEARS
jgi:hypothetical protein